MKLHISLVLNVVTHLVGAEDYQKRLKALWVMKI